MNQKICEGCAAMAEGLCSGCLRKSINFLIDENHELRKRLELAELQFVFFVGAS